MRNRTTLIFLLLFIVILYVLSQNGGFSSLSNVFSGTPYSGPSFGVTVRPLFPTPIGGAFLNATVRPYVPPAVPVSGGFSAGGYNGGSAPQSNNTNGSTSNGAGSDPNSAYAGRVGCVVPNGWVPYTIQPGDTIGTIAAAYNIGLDQFTTFNCLANPDLVYVGQIVFVPATGR